MSVSPASTQLEVWHLGARRHLWGCLLQQRGLLQGLVLAVLPLGRLSCPLHPVQTQSHPQDWGWMQ